jgi:hypothetical protein
MLVLCANKHKLSELGCDCGQTASWAIRQNPFSVNIVWGITWERPLVNITGGWAVDQEFANVYVAPWTSSGSPWVAFCVPEVEFGLPCGPIWRPAGAFGVTGPYWCCLGVPLWILIKIRYNFPNKWVQQLVLLLRTKSSAPLFPNRSSRHLRKCFQEQLLGLFPLNRNMRL